MGAPLWRGIKSEVTRSHGGTVAGGRGQQGSWGLHVLYQDALKRVSSVFGRLLLGCHSRASCAWMLAVNGYGVDKTSVNHHLLRSYQHTLRWRLKSIVFSLWLYFTANNTKAPFWETLIRPRPGALPARARRYSSQHVTLRARGFHGNPGPGFRKHQHSL